MADALIIDACRTPRGIGKAGKGALADIHPQHLGADRAAGARRAQRHQHRRRRRHHLGHQFAARPAERRSRPHGGARRRLRRPRQRRHPRPLLRFGHHGVNIAAASIMAGIGRPRHRRRHRDDVDARPPRRGPADDGRRQPAPARAASAVASGRLRRRHRDAGRHHAPGVDELALESQQTRRARDQGRPFRQEPRAGASRRRHARARPRGVSAPADHARRPRRA